MKTAIYIEDGKSQLVLTPEDQFEKAIVDKIEKGRRECFIRTGSFYECRGGWVKHGAEETSLMITIGIDALD